MNQFEEYVKSSAFNLNLYINMIEVLMALVYRLLKVTGYE